MTTVTDVLSVFGRWLHLPDPLPLFAVLGAVAANRLEGDPVWLVLVGPPGGGKSELLGSITGLTDVHPAATLTEAALLSGTPKREQAGGAKGGLLREIGDFGILVHKDFGSVLSMNRDARAAVLAALRELFDGSWTRHVGTDGGRTLTWSGKLGLIAGCTPTIDRHHAVMGSMGERFVLFRLPIVDADQQALSALDHAGHERRMRAELAAVVTALFADMRLDAVRPLSQAERLRLVALTTLIVRARSAIERDGYTREIELIPDSEAPTRPIVVLERLLAGLHVVGVERADAWRVVTKAALDSIPALRRRVMDVLLEAEAEMPTAKVAEALDHPLRTSERALEDLTGHGLVRRYAHGQGKATTWELTPWTIDRYRLVQSSPETSSSEGGGTSPETSSSLFSNPHRVFDDISGDVADAEVERMQEKLHEAAVGTPKTAEAKS